MTVSEEIAKLHELHARGALTAEEFARAKARILGTEPPAPGSFAVSRAPIPSRLSTPGAPRRRTRR